MKEVGQYFKERFDQFEPNLPSDFWSKIQNDKALKKFNRVQFLKRVLIYGFTPAAIISIAILLFFLPNKQTLLTQRAPLELIQDTIQTPVKEKTPEIIIEKTNTPDPITRDFEKVVVNVIKQTLAPPSLSVTSNNITNLPTPKKEITPVSKEKDSTKGRQTQIDQLSIDTNRNKMSEPQIDNDPNVIVEEPIQPAYNSESANNFIVDPQEDDPNKLFIPKAFSPNGDLINDIFKVSANWDVEEFEMYIYERGGALVFKSQNIGMGWDGTYHGKETYSGVYAYMIIYKDSKGNKQKTKGTLNLIR